MKAVYPVALYRMIKGIGAKYLQPLGIFAGGVLIVKLLSLFDLWSPAQFAVILFTILSLFSIRAADGRSCDPRRCDPRGEASSERPRRLACVQHCTAESVSS